jgi:hypothetical protein
VIPPVALVDDENRQVYDGGSKEKTNLYRSTWLSEVPPMLLSLRTRFQPVGGVIVPLPDSRVVTTATMMSPGSASG